MIKIKNKKNKIIFLSLVLMLFILPAISVKGEIIDEKVNYWWNCTLNADDKFKSDYVLEKDGTIYCLTKIQIADENNRPDEQTNQLTIQIIGEYFWPQNPIIGLFIFFAMLFILFELIQAIPNHFKNKGKVYEK